MQLIGANPAPPIASADEMITRSNYFIGNDPKQWRTNIHHYGKVKYSDVYPGVDLVYYGNQRQLEYDFVVRPGTDPKAIKMRFQGTDRLDIDKHGDLILHIGDDTICHHKPKIYQYNNGIKESLAGNYILQGKDEVSFEIVNYDINRPLIMIRCLYILLTWVAMALT